MDIAEFIIDIVFCIIWGVIWGFATKKVIEKKGYSENWFIWGFIFGIIAFFVALIKSDNQQQSQQYTNLSNGEEIVAKAEISKIAIIPTIIFSSIVALGIIIFALWNGAVGGELAAIVFTAICIAAIIIFCKIAIISNIELSLTNKKIFGKTGLLNKIEMDSPIGKINNVTIKSGLGGQLFGYGTVVICTSSGTYNFKLIKSPEAFKTAVIDQIEIAEEERIRKQAEQLAYTIKQ